MTQSVTINMFSTKMSLMIAKTPVWHQDYGIFSTYQHWSEFILVRYFWPVLNTKQAEPGRDILLPWGDQETFLFAPNTLYISSTPWISTVLMAFGLH